MPWRKIKLECLYACGCACLLAPEFYSGMFHSVAHDERQSPPFWGQLWIPPSELSCPWQEGNGYYSRYGKGG
ncbi:hypothetical protein GGR53DRAFT_503187 [Hypoxylon sp. FL1150]|nr:hypothetical protein GGR53DRAFT_503187 [Hypoxylon sp. FL1150]